MFGEEKEKKETTKVKKVGPIHCVIRTRRIGLIPLTLGKLFPRILHPPNRQRPHITQRTIMPLRIPSLRCLKHVPHSLISRPNNPPDGVKSLTREEEREQSERGVGGGRERGREILAGQGLLEAYRPLLHRPFLSKLLRFVNRSHQAKLIEKVEQRLGKKNRK